MPADRDGQLQCREQEPKLLVRSHVIGQHGGPGDAEEQAGAVDVGAENEGGPQEKEREERREDDREALLVLYRIPMLFLICGG